ncbi:class I SAM-dependent methyltransferase [Nocardia aurantia]|uniref:Ubiquinone/menaquinone biosynthesis C-methyltransferase UbiE n=1 Tax=Nocardia aurantia TaxID=2585199 RepID=A0A7K0DY90_9NOCA|nr:class I SAM-dependent methyltransferase [Nocardia aurantia]MQY30766.1 Ubiquinone/menaquinone biosynthesis C-methyltransferase UbiE [Nocardia aurantia]
MNSTAPTRGFNDVITGSFDRLARVYDTALVQQVFYRPPQDETIAELRRNRSRRIADIGCGTGILASRIQRELRPEQVFGVDASPGMLEQARARNPLVTWLHSAAESLPFDDGALDALVTTTAFHFFDQRAAVAEFARVVGAGGLVVVATMHYSGPLARGIQQVTRNSFAPAHAPAPDETRDLLRDAGFDVLDQRKVHRPLPNRLIPDVITLGRRR